MAKSIPISVRMSDELFSHITKDAERCDMARSAYVRMLVGDALWHLGDASTECGVAHVTLESLVEKGILAPVTREVKLDEVKEALREVLAEPAKAKQATPSAKKAPATQNGNVTIKLSAVG